MTRLAERIYRTEGIVLRRMELGEADRILTLYTPQYGKLRAMAKGIRRPASKLRGHLELFTRAKLMLARGRNLDVITAAETTEAFRGLRAEDSSSLEPVGGAYRIAERLDRLTEDGVENRAVWDLLVAALGALSDGVPPRMVGLHFDLRLLGYLGYQPNLDSCAGCDRPLEPIENRYSFELGGVLCPDCRSHDPAADPLSVNALKLLRLMARQDARVVARLRLPEGLLDELEGLLNRSVRLTTDRDFAAPAVLRSLQGES
ncbi:MAG: DNA recombination and repair protein RecO [uncultured Thermomicrobiales bacterium]|uniref:DNA repair protein RecO n=1 Tax=uncultured Thermomicrobiales bacterium TaxID=1645740 RepID=A0A6J4VUE3_9BACT|nr:MAG: DNA recombination and repair protein RecO [uncultured Thermomicrobiales bacterium]